jgi:hypothetical protein
MKTLCSLALSLIYNLLPLLVKFLKKIFQHYICSKKSFHRIKGISHLVPYSYCEHNVVCNVDRSKCETCM